MKDKNKNKDKDKNKNEESLEDYLRDFAKGIALTLDTEDGYRDTIMLSSVSTISFTRELMSRDQFVRIGLSDGSFSHYPIDRYNYVIDTAIEAGFLFSKGDGPTNIGTYINPAQIIFVRRQPLDHSVAYVKVAGNDHPFPICFPVTLKVKGGK